MDKYVGDGIISKEQADRIIAAIDPLDGGWSEIATFVRSLQYTKTQSHKTPLTDDQIAIICTESTG